MKIKLLFVPLLVLLLSSCAPQGYAVPTAAVATAEPTAEPTAVPSDPARLTVRGEGNIEVAPDLLQLRLGVLTHQPSADAALAENSRRMAAIMAQLAAIGIATDEMATGQFQVRPEWSLPPRPTPANWQRKIVGYRVINELLIATPRVELAGRLLTTSQQAGANQIGGLQFTLADPADARQQAIARATKNALRQAETMATAAGVKLGAIKSMSLDSPGGRPQPQLMVAEARMASADSVPVAAGKVEISAAVTMVFQLQE